MKTFKDSYNMILEECREALDKMEPASVESFIAELERAEKVFFVGVGRVLLSLEAMAKRLSHLGIRCEIVGGITEPSITERDLLVVGSGSGESIVPVAIAKKAKSLGARIVHIGSNPQSSLAPFVDLFVRIPVPTRLALPGEIASKQPLTSLFEQSLLLFGDAVACMLIDRHNLDMKTLWRFHANLE